MSKNNKGFDLSSYDMVKDRINAYQEEYPDYRVETEVTFTSKPSADVVIVKAGIFKNREEQAARTPHGTGIAEETRDAGFVNKTSHVENAETSAIGRALANVNFKMSDKRPSKEEMEKVQRTKEAKSSKKKAEPKKEEKVEVKEDTRDADEFETALNECETMNEVVKLFNAEVNKREGEEKTKFEEKYQPIANDKIADLRG